MAALVALCALGTGCGGSRVGAERSAARECLPLTRERARRCDLAFDVSRRLVFGLRLPHGAVRIRSEPRGGGPNLQAPFPNAGCCASGSAWAWGWWLVPGSMRAVVAFVRNHGPEGSARASLLSLNGWTLRAEEVAFDVSAGAAWHGASQLHVVVASLPDGGTGLLIFGTTTWA